MPDHTEEWEVELTSGKKKPTYTTEIHVYRLKAMLERDYPCGMCPASRQFLSNMLGPEELWNHNPSPCSICRKFIDAAKTDSGGWWCPCFKLGKEEALRRTYLAIEEYEQGG